MPFVSIIRFNTPYDLGESTSLDINLCPRRFSGSLDCTIYHALCTSDHNHNKYLNAGLEVNDPNIIARGSMRLEDYFSPFSIQTNKLKSSATYYLIFWMYPHSWDDTSSYSGETAAYHGITVNYTPKYEKSAGFHECTVLGHCMRRDGSVDDEDLTYDLNNGTTGVLNSSYTQISIIKFTAPYFAGKSTCLTVDLYEKDALTGNGDFLTCCAICDTADGYEHYLKATQHFTSTHQLAKVTLPKESFYSQSGPFAIHTDQLEGGKDYYLILWQPTDFDNIGYVRFGAAKNHAITVYYNSVVETMSLKGVFHVENVSGHDEYELFIDGETEWCKVVGGYRVSGSAYVSNGVSTVNCGFKPDVVVFSGFSYTDNDTFYEMQMSAVFSEKETSYPLLVIMHSDDYPYMDMFITQTETGFELSGCRYYDYKVGDYVSLNSVALNYTAIKYT